MGKKTTPKLKSRAEHRQLYDSGDEQANVAQLLEQSIRKPLSVAHVVDSYSGLTAVLGGLKGVSEGNCSALCSAPHHRTITKQTATSFAMDRGE
jgi:hypothetical protein